MRAAGSCAVVDPPMVRSNPSVEGRGGGCEGGGRVHGLRLKTEFRRALGDVLLALVWLATGSLHCSRSNN